MREQTILSFQLEDRQGDKGKGATAKHELRSGGAGKQRERQNQRQRQQLWIPDQARNDGNVKTPGFQLVGLGRYTFPE